MFQLTLDQLQPPLFWIATHPRWARRMCSRSRTSMMLIAIFVFSQASPFCWPVHVVLVSCPTPSKNCPPPIERNTLMLPESPSICDRIRRSAGFAMSIA